MDPITQAIQQAVSDAIKPLCEEVQALRSALSKREELGELLNYDEAEDLYRISRTTLYRLRRAGDLEAVTIGRRVLFRRSDLERMAQTEIR